MTVSAPGEAAISGSRLPSGAQPARVVGPHPHEVADALARRALGEVEPDEAGVVLGWGGDPRLVRAVEVDRVGGLAGLAARRRCGRGPGRAAQARGDGPGGRGAEPGRADEAAPAEALATDGIGAGHR